MSKWKTSVQLFPWCRNLEEGLLKLSSIGFTHCEIGSSIVLNYKDELDYLTYLFDRYNVLPSAVFAIGNFNRYRDIKMLLFHHEQLSYCLERLKIKNVVLHPGLQRRSNITNSQIVTTFEKIYKRYENRGIAVGIHPHIGSPIFYQNEIDILIELCSRRNMKISLVPDLGHLYEASIEPIDFIKAYQSIISNIHFKNILKISSQLRKGKFTSLVQGDLNIPQILSMLRDINYNKWITLEIEEKYISNETLSESYRLLLANTI